jgi:polysaccharide export outer membrane protein
MRTLTLLLGLLLAPALLAPALRVPPSALLGAQTAPSHEATAIPAPEGYVIGAQDQLSITVFEEPELSGKYRVDTDGHLTFPLLARVRAAGRTLSELQTDLTEMLRSGYLRNPQVRVEVDQYKSQSVFVSGEVRAPGKVAMMGTSMTLLEALAQAGSPTSAASNVITVTRRSDAGAGDGAEPVIIRVSRRDLETGRSGHDLVLRDGDIINVPPAQRFYIAGHVRSPGFYVLEPGMTVQQAIALSGGLTDRGSDRGITATRLVNGKAVDVPVKLEDAVLANDTLNVRQRFF